MKNKKTAFSLAELSMVVLIIGILLSGITVGSRLVISSSLNAARLLTASSPVASIDSLVLWLETTSKKSFDFVPINNSNISTWIDINPHADSSSQNNAGLGVAPTYVEKAINDLPALSFDGSTQYLQGGPLGISGSGAGTIFIVSISDAKTTNSTAFSFGINTSSTANRIKRLDLNTDISDSGWRFAGGSNRLFNENINAGTPYISTWYNEDGAAHNNHERFLNNTLSTTASASSSIPDLVDNEYLVGSGRNGSAILGRYFDGYIGEIIVFNKKLRSSQIDAIEEYLSQKWDIELN